MDKQVLIVDDEEAVLRSLSKQLEDYGFSVITADSFQKAMKVLDDNILVVLLDLKFPKIDGIEILKKIKEFKFEIPVIILTGYGDIPTVVEALKEGADDFISKPPEISDLVKKIRLYSEKNLLKDMLYDSLSNQLGKSRKIKRIIKDVDTASKRKLSIVITGEAGTGKSFLAKLIHDMSRYKNKPFYNITILTDSADIELFGENKDGLLYQIEQGFVVLNDIEMLNQDSQRRLLSFLEENDKTSERDFQLVSTSRANLVELVKKQEFREDLFYNLAEFNIHLPCLEERQSDISFFAKKFIFEDADDFNPKINTIDEAAIKALTKHSWKGNIRELRSVIRRALVMSEGKKITKTIVEQIIKNDLLGQSKSKYINEVFEMSKKPQPLWFIEKQAIIQTLKYYKGNKSDTARVLELARTTLYKKMEEYNIEG